MLYDKIFLLARRPSGDSRVSGSVLGAGLAAACLAELRRRDRLGLDNDTGSVQVRNPQPIGSAVADEVLSKIDAGESQPPHLWLETLRDAVTKQVSAGVGNLDRTQLENCRADARRRIADAVRAGDSSVDLDLGELVWAMELAPSVLGWDVGTRFWLGRAAARDWLPRSVREWMGMSVRLPRDPTAGYGGWR